MRQLHPEAIAAIQSKALFSKAEEQLLSKVGSVSLGSRKVESQGSVQVGMLSPHPLTAYMHMQMYKGLCDWPQEEPRLAP